MSSKKYYKVIDTNMFISQAPDREFTLKYDLTNYMLVLAKKEKKEFIFKPIDKKLKLSEVRFVANDAEERGIWYKRLQEVMRTDTSLPLRLLH